MGFFQDFFKKHFCRTPVGRQLEMGSDIFLASCSSDLITLFCCGNLSPSLLEGLLGPACLSEYFSNLAFMFGTRGANQFHVSQENPYPKQISGLTNISVAVVKICKLWSLNATLFTFLPKYLYFGGQCTSLSVGKNICLRKEHVVKGIPA